MTEVRKGLALLRVDKKLLALFAGLIADTIFLVSIVSVGIAWHLY